jgi:hypothetical protein
LHFYGFQGAGGIAGWRNFALSTVDELAASVASAEKDEALTPSESRRRLKEAIERRYTSPA